MFEEKKTWIRLGFGAACFLVGLLISDPASKLVCLIAAWFFCGYPVIWEGICGLFHGEFLGECILMTVASIGAIAIGDTAEGAAVMLLYSIGETLQDRAEEKTRDAVTALMRMHPESITVLCDGLEKRITPQEARPGDILLIKPGERIALDGVILSGKAALDCSALTGESMPVSVQEGDHVAAGCICTDGRLELRVTSAFADSTLSEMLRLMEESIEKKARIEKAVTRFAGIYTPAVCGLAVLLFLIPVLFFHGEVTEWGHRALGFLVVSCPCALVISIPLSYFGGLGAASRRGILIKSSETIEKLNRVSTVVLDKTGTLTQGEFEVILVHAHEFDEARLIQAAAAVESASLHPVSRSICAYAGYGADAYDLSEVHEVPGYGISAVWQGQSISVGNDAYMRYLGLSVPPCPHEETVIHVAADQIYIGHIVIADKLKPRAAETIRDLRKFGIKRMVMLTGDKESIARKVSASLDLKEYQAELLPSDKVKAVEQLMNEQAEKARLLFAGDGLNDAPVLSRADVGIAVGAMASDIAVEAADVVLMDGDPHKLCEMLTIARRTCSIVHQNMSFCMAAKLGLLLLSTFGMLPMWLAVFGDVGVCLIAIANAARCLQIKGN